MEILIGNNPCPKNKSNDERTKEDDERTKRGMQKKGENKHKILKFVGEPDEYQVMSSNSENRNPLPLEVQHTHVRVLQKNTPLEGIVGAFLQFLKQN